MPNQPEHKDLNSQSGIVLIIVLLISTILIMLIYQFRSYASIELSLSAYRMSRVTNSFALDGAYRYAKIMLAKDENETVDDKTELWGSVFIPFKVGDCTVTFRIIDEASKFNLRSLLGETAATGKEQFLRLLQQNKNIENPEELLAAVLDYIDQVPAGETEDGDYEETARNRMFDTIEELQKVKGMTPSILYDTSQGPGLSSLVTLMPDAAPLKVNFNTASREVLLALHEDLNESNIDALIMKRIEEPFANANEIQEILEDDYGRVQNYIRLNSTYFSFDLLSLHGTHENRARVFVLRSGQNITKIFWADGARFTLPVNIEIE